MGQLRLALREVRREEEERQPERKRLLPPDWKRFRTQEIKELAMERIIPVCGPDGKAKAKEALIRDLLRWCERQPTAIRGGSSGRASRCSGRAGQHDDRVGTEQETPTGSDGRGHLHDSNGSKTLMTILVVLGTSRRRTTRRPWQEVGTICTELKDKLPREQPVAGGQHHCVRHLFAMMALQLGTHMEHDGGWRQREQQAASQSCEIVRMTISHRTSVVSVEDQGSFGVLFCVAPEQDLERLP